MAQVSIIVKAFVFAVVVATFSAAAATVSAQEYGMAPAPSPDVGSAFYVPVSGAVIGTSLLFSLLAFLRH